MTRKATPYVSLDRFGLPDISMPAIRRYARQVAERFKPDKIILFGSFAYGEPNEDSDVDLLVVMRCPNEITQSVRIQNVLEAPFAMDLIVRTPKRLRQRLSEGSWFLREIMEKGVVLYEKRNSTLDKKSRRRYAHGTGRARERPPVHDGICFHCQQAAEKYLKGFLRELDEHFPRTHDLVRILDLALPHDPTLRTLRRGLRFLKVFAVDVRYPDTSANARQSKAALRWAERVRKEFRRRLKLRP